MLPNARPVRITMFIDRVRRPRSRATNRIRSPTASRLSGQRVELVWLGTPEQVENIRDATLEISQELADQMELEWYTEVGDDPFYLEGRKSEDRGIEFPDVPKYEMRLVVPGADKGVAAVSANVHGTHFTEGFSIKEAHQKTLWTGCTGIGITRWLFGFLAQKGFDKEKWPVEVKEKVDKVKVPRMVTWP